MYNNLKINSLYIANNFLTGIDISNLKELKQHDLLSMANLNTDYANFYPTIAKKVYDRNNKMVTSGKIGTGFRVETENMEYNVTVLGDINGDGELSAVDVSKVYQYLKEKIEMEEYDIFAANVSKGNKNITIADVAQMYQYLKGKINRWE